ncbi:MAG: pitrilysin family protein [Clostridia bacterium]
MEKIKKYSNGLTLAYQYSPTVRSVAIGVFVNVGSINEDSKTNGISHFIEHMMFKGTKRRTAFDIVAESDNIGAQINAFTSKTNTCYYMVCVDNDTEKCVDILSDLFFNSVFPNEEIEKEKGVVLEEISMTIDTPDDLCLEMATSAFYKGHPLSRQILGTRKNVQGFTREDILNYIDLHYTPDNILISVVGNITLKEVEILINKYFIGNFSLKKSPNKQIKHFEGNSTFIKKCKKIEQSHIAFIFPSMAYCDKLTTALKVFNTAFGYGMSSRLFQNVRENLGLAYSVYSYPSFYTTNGCCSIYLGTNSNSVEKATLAVKDEIDKVLKFGITEAEFLRGKAQMRSAFVFGQESTSSMMTMIARHTIMTGEACDIDKMLLDIENVTLDDVNEVIKQVFDFNKVTACYVGPKCDVDLLKLIKG